MTGARRRAAWRCSAVTSTRSPRWGERRRVRRRVRRPLPNVALETRPQEARIVFMSDSAAPAPKPAVSRGSAWKIVASVVVICGAVGLMLKSSMTEGAQYYKHVDEVMANPNAWRGKRLQVHGHVVDGSIEQARGTL